ncbi:HNH endonuclease signature motif containing protein [Alloalcanivorax gelatiniphagus]
MPTDSSPDTHPILRAVADVRASLKAVADANPTFMTTDAKAAALRELVAAEGQLAELRLRILADAGDLAGGTAPRGAAGWLAQHTRTRFDDARADLALATALDREGQVLAAAMREGAVTLAQARVVQRAVAALPATVDAGTRAQAEAHLVEQAGEFGPKELGRIGRRILDVVAPDIAEAAEAARLADLEANAERLTRLSMRRLGDGTTRISSRVPDHAATRFATYLEAYASPRREASATRVDDRGDASAATAHDLVARLAYPKRMGQAFVQLLEGLDPGRLPIHGGDATTVVVTIPLASLRADLAAGDLIGGGLVPGDDLTGAGITAGQVRRLACTARILPAVLGGDSLPLDLGRSRRLFSPGQRKALLLRDRTCRAEGCDVPGTWCEAHHLRPWHRGGRTDLRDGTLLCSQHHHRAHDLAFNLERLANGDIRFHRRR